MKSNMVTLARNIGLLSMLITLVVGGLASYLHEVEVRSALVQAAADIASVSFILWAACGLYLWFKLWAWLFASWATRGALQNFAWSVLILAGSIILPLFVHHRLAAQPAWVGERGIQ